MAGKWHLGNTEGFRPTERGFDEFYGILGGGSQNLPGPLAGKEVGSRLMIVRGITPEPATEYLQDAWAREAVRFVAAHRSQPWFFYLAFNAVHTLVEATPQPDLPLTECPRLARGIVTLHPGAGPLPSTKREPPTGKRWASPRRSRRG